MTLRILAVVLAAGILLVSVSFLMFGAATGLGKLFVANLWLGWVITGGVFLVGAILFLSIYFSKTKKVSSDPRDIRAWVKKYPYQSTGAAVVAGFIAARTEPSDITDIFKEVLLPLLVEHLQSKQKDG